MRESFHRGNISIDLLKDRDESSGSGARSDPPLSIESQSRDRSPRSTIQILGHRNSFSALLLRCLLYRSKEKREDQDGERRELCGLLLNIQSTPYKDSPFLFQAFHLSFLLSLSPPPSPLISTIFL